MARLALILAVAVVIGGCKAGFERAQDDRICSKPPETPRGLDDCLHRWAYRLARSPDPAEVVAKAVVKACSREMAEVAQLFANNPKLAEREDLFESISRSAPELALFRVVQARAGNCAPV